MASMFGYATCSHSRHEEEHMSLTLEVWFLSVHLLKTSKLICDELTDPCFVNARGFYDTQFSILPVSMLVVSSKIIDLLHYVFTT